MRFTASEDHPAFTPEVNPVENFSPRDLLYSKGESTPISSSLPAIAAQLIPSSFQAKISLTTRAAYPSGTSLFLSRERGVGGVLLTNRLTSPGREAKNVDPCRIAFHEAILAADEEGWL